MGALSSFLNLLTGPPPDPKRYAAQSAPYNWNGTVNVDTRRGGAKLVNEKTNTFEFGLSSVEIPEDLTDLDKKGLQARGLDPENPAYAACKKYFAKMPFCNKQDLAANSSGDDFQGITPNTAKNVLAAFREYLIDKPTF